MVTTQWLHLVCYRVNPADIEKRIVCESVHSAAPNDTYASPVLKHRASLAGEDNLSNSLEEANLIKMKWSTNK